MIKTPGCDKMLDDQDSCLWFNVSSAAIKIVDVLVENAFESLRLKGWKADRGLLEGNYSAPLSEDPKDAEIARWRVEKGKIVFCSYAGLIFKRAQCSFLLSGSRFTGCETNKFTQMIKYMVIASNTKMKIGPPYASLVCISTFSWVTIWLIKTRSLDNSTFDHNQKSWSSNIWSQPGFLIIQHLITTRSLDHSTFGHDQESWSYNIWSQPVD